MISHSKYLLLIIKSIALDRLQENKQLKIVQINVMWGVYTFQNRTNNECHENV